MIFTLVVTRGHSCVLLDKIVLNAVFSKQNISCFEIRRPRPIWSVNVFFMHSAAAVDIYRAQRKHINYSIWPLRISRHDLRRRYSNLLVIDAGSQFRLRACSQAMCRGNCPNGEETMFFRKRNVHTIRRCEIYCSATILRRDIGLEVGEYIR
jgi:hypothetical protein